MHVYETSVCQRDMSLFGVSYADVIFLLRVGTALKGLISMLMAIRCFHLSPFLLALL